MRRVVFYISGHGYGHATRSIELIRALLAKSAELYFHIKTDATRWLFDLNLQRNYSFHDLNMDVGAVQQTSFFIDQPATLDRWLALLEKKSSIVAAEAEFIRRTEAKLVIADIPPFAFDIADAADVPGVALANFSWDWIYSEYTTEHPEFSQVIHDLQQSYGKAARLLRLPFHGDLSAFPEIKDIPLIARTGSRPKQEIWQLLDIELNPRPVLVLVALRAADLANVDLSKAFGNQDFLFITFGLDATQKNSRNLAPDFMRFSEMVNACDIVISKPGYGIVSEIIANRTPLLYASRDDFVEYSVLVKGLEDYAVSRLLPRHDYFAGNWHSHLTELLRSDQHWSPIPLDGAKRGADEILNLMGAASRENPNHNESNSK